MLSLSCASLPLHRPLRSVLPAPDSYITHIDHLSAAIPLALSLPASRISFRDPANLTEVVGWPAHASGITSLKASSDTLVLTAGKDGHVAHWDYRTPSGIVESMCSPNKTALLSADYSPEHYLVVAGTELHSEEAHLLYWDIRSPSQLLRQHSSTHSDDITSVSLHKSEGSYRLLSASTDGLLCSSNPLENDEDESVLSVANWGTSISKTGFVNESVWSLSDMETLAFWDNELSLLRDFGDVRVPKAALPMSNSLFSREWKMDYVVDILQPSSRPDTVLLLGGANSGNVAFVNVPLNPLPGMEWTMEGIAVGHEGVVRCAHWDTKRNVLLTGGEDSQLCTWMLGEKDETIGMDVDTLPLVKKRDTNTLRTNETSKRPRV